MLRPPTRRVAVGVAGSGWVRGAGRGKTARGWKGVRSWVRPRKPDGDEPVRSPKNTSATITSGSQEPKILSKTMSTYSLSVYEMMIFRNSIQSGTEFHYQ